MPLFLTIGFRRGWAPSAIASVVSTSGNFISAQLVDFLRSAAPRLAFGSRIYFFRAHILHGSISHDGLVRWFRSDRSASCDRQLFCRYDLDSSRLPVLRNSAGRQCQLPVKWGIYLAASAVERFCGFCAGARDLMQCRPGAALSVRDYLLQTEK